MLVIALGLVLATMRQLGRPSTARRLEKLFTSRPSTAAPLAPNFETPLQQADQGQEEQGRREPVSPSSPVANGSPDTDASEVDLSQVEDKTYFRPAERKAWFSLFAKLQQADRSQLLRDTCGEVTYVQFLQQPEVYRGRIVTIVGKVVREEIEQPAENQLGIDSYHRLWIQPQGGGQWPLVVYCLKLPAEFPRGENLRAPVTVTGYFFKNWSYAYQEGLGLAPVVLASQLQWQPPAARPVFKPITGQSLAIGLAAASIFAAITT